MDDGDPVANHGATSDRDLSRFFHEYSQSMKRNARKRGELKAHGNNVRRNIDYD
jgi:hypothetical protein